MSRFFAFIALIAFCLPFSAQAHDCAAANDFSQEEALAYIERYKALAIREMHLYCIPASSILAQAMLESRNGQSELARATNNHFGIKCRENWSGPTYQHKDDDYDAQGNLLKSCFREYASVTESYRDHSEFLSGRKYYTKLFQLPLHDYRAWCMGLQACGYATNQEYGKKLIELIERHKLYLLDQTPNRGPLRTLKPVPFQFGNGSSPAVAAEPAVALEEMAAEPSAAVVLRDEPENTRVVYAGTPDRRPAPRKEPFVPAAGAAPQAPMADPFGHHQVPVLREDSLIASFLGIALSGDKHLLYNGLQAVRVGAADELELIAADHGLSASKLAKYNELAPSAKLKAGWVLYLEPKEDRPVGSIPMMHLVRAGETVFEIAQKYALGLSKLRRLNHLSEGQELAAGTVLYLQVSAPEAARVLPAAEKALERKAALERLFGLK
jgi:LysM repeat protein